MANHDLPCEANVRRVDSLKGLEVALAAFGEDVLYRGQTRHFGNAISSGLRTSFDRQGCTPPLMIKWAHYAEFMLRQLADDAGALDRLEFVQAILQHYGFRSFYLDLSGSAALSSYFAGWRWTSKHTVELVEDCFEDPVFAQRELATYVPADGETSLYVVSKEALSKALIGLHDLSDLSLHVGGQARYIAQAAWLVGPLHGELPSACVIEHIVAPAAAFRDYAKQAGFAEVADVFPDKNVDPVLHLLLTLPWIKVPSVNGDKNFGITLFERALRIPEYHEVDLSKHQPATTAFFRGEKISEMPIDPTLTICSAPAHMIFGSFDKPAVFPRVANLIRRNKRVLFEVDELVWLPESMRQATWGKGVWVEERLDGRIQIGDLVVEHPGQQMTGFGALAMWAYDVDSAGRWTRSETEDDCACGHTWRHQAHLSAIGIMEYELARRDGAPR